ncbi:unnamed protein product [Euphydryas editha]|uniref:Uncharacterized protein n=1 Tax=Euphydryas editha TaxID=104508 RepID=A0AAU9V147_EUPED|nr:unnamed protein product [Euphydryas editha]
MDKIEDSEKNADISDSAYNNHCNNNQKKRSSVAAVKQLVQFYMVTLQLLRRQKLLINLMELIEVSNAYAKRIIAITAFS